MDFGKLRIYIGGITSYPIDDEADVRDLIDGNLLTHGTVVQVTGDDGGLREIAARDIPVLKKPLDKQLGKELRSRKKTAGEQPAPAEPAVAAVDADQPPHLAEDAASEAVERAETVVPAPLPLAPIVLPALDPAEPAHPIEQEMETASIADAPASEKAAGPAEPAPPPPEPTPAKDEQEPPQSAAPDGGSPPPATLDSSGPSAGPGGAGPPPRRKWLKSLAITAAIVLVVVGGIGGAYVAVQLLAPKTRYTLVAVTPVTADLAPSPPELAPRKQVLGTVIEVAGLKFLKIKDNRGSFKLVPLDALTDEIPPGPADFPERGEQRVIVRGPAYQSWTGTKLYRFVEAGETVEVRSALNGNLVEVALDKGRIAYMRASSFRALEIAPQAPPIILPPIVLPSPPPVTPSPPPPPAQRTSAPAPAPARPAVEWQTEEPKSKPAPQPAPKQPPAVAGPTTRQADLRLRDVRERPSGTEQWALAPFQIRRAADAGTLRPYVAVVRVRCRVDSSYRLVGCRVVSPDDKGEKYSIWALKIAELYRVFPSDRRGQSTIGQYFEDDIRINH